MKANPRRSVLLLVADDWSRVAGFLGDPLVRTPHLDAFRDTATHFENAFCTSPSCAASRANLLTGLYSHQHGQYGHCHAPHGFRTHRDVRSLPAVLNDAGVRTGLLGKDHVAPREVYPFQTYDTSATWDNGALAAHAADFYRGVGDAPFYLHVGSNYPHRTDGDFRREVGAEPAGGDVTYAPQEVVVPPWLPDCDAVRRDLADYYAFVTRFDDFVGGMLRALEASGRADDTLVVVTSDHGLPFPAAKASPFEAGHHCPLLVRDPIRATAATSDALVNWTDLMPTLLDWFGVAYDDPKRELTGRSLLPEMGRDHAPDWGRTYYSHAFHEITNYFPYRAVRDRRWKYVKIYAHALPMPLPTDLFDSRSWQAMTRDGEPCARPLARVRHHPEEALYDLDADPLEAANLLDAPEHAGRAAEMRAACLDLQARTRDPWLELDYQRGRIPTRPEPA